MWILLQRIFTSIYVNIYINSMWKHITSMWIYTTLQHDRKRNGEERSHLMHFKAISQFIL